MLIPIITVISVILLIAGYSLTAFTHTEYWKQLNHLESNTTIEELLLEGTDN